MYLTGTHTSISLAFDFLLDPKVIKSLETFCAVFQISPGWYNTYTGCLTKTEVPSLFQGLSVPVPHGHLAVHLTSRMKGAQVFTDNVPEGSLQPYSLVKKNMLLHGYQEQGWRGRGTNQDCPISDEAFFQVSDG